MRKQRIIIITTCDHCPDGALQEVAETVIVGYGSARHELDLCAPHKATLDKTMAGIVTGTRRVSRAPAGSKEDKKFRDDARAWAADRGLPVNRVGVIPASTMAAYREYLRQEVL